jgi:hypothetical protein
MKLARSVSPKPKPTTHDKLEAARLTAALGFRVTPAQVRDDRLAEAAKTRGSEKP